MMGRPPKFDLDFRKHAVELARVSSRPRSKIAFDLGVSDSHETVDWWSFADHRRTELVTDALHAAVRFRGGTIPPGVIFHSDRGSVYTSTEYGLTCKLYKIRQSMGRRGVCCDNAQKFGQHRRKATRPSRRFNAQTEQRHAPTFLRGDGMARTKPQRTRYPVSKPTWLAYRNYQSCDRDQPRRKVKQSDRSKVHQASRVREYLADSNANVGLCVGENKSFPDSLNELLTLLNFIDQRSSQFQGELRKIGFKEHRFIGICG
jgi:Integrase core domain